MTPSGGLTQPALFRMLQWIESTTSSVFYWLALGASGDERVATLSKRYAWIDRIRELTDLDDQVAGTEIDWTSVWRVASLTDVRLFAEEESTDERLLKRLLVNALDVCTVQIEDHAALDDLVDRLVEAIEELRAGGMEAELRLRAQPLRQAWSARGPGYLHQLKKGPTPLRDLEATAILVAPVGSGWGDIDFDRGTLLVESVLTNLDDRLPEVARLAWLVTRLLMQVEDAEAAKHITLETAMSLDWIVDDAAPELADKLWTL